MTGSQSMRPRFIHSRLIGIKSLIYLVVLTGVCAVLLCGCQTRTNWTKPATSGGPPDLSYMAGDYKTFMAHATEAIKDPTICTRLPGIVIEENPHIFFSTYYRNFGYGAGHGVAMLSYEVRFRRGGRTLASAVFSRFPSTISSATSSLETEVDELGRELFVDLLRNREFTQEDLAKLSLSKIAEVRFGTAQLIKDQGLLTKLAVDAVSEIRLAAVQNPNLTDIKNLSKIIDDQTKRLNAKANKITKWYEDQEYLPVINAAAVKLLDASVAGKKLTAVSETNAAGITAPFNIEGTSWFAKTSEGEYLSCTFLTNGEFRARQLAPFHGYGLLSENNSKLILSTRSPRSAENHLKWKQKGSTVCIEPKVKYSFIHDWKLEGRTSPDGRCLNLKGTHTWHGELLIGLLLGERHTEVTFVGLKADELKYFD